MKILFSCTANICRSVIAEGILKKLLSEHSDTPAIQVLSAGVNAFVGATPNRKTVEVCREHSVDIESHKSQQLIQTMLEEADIVLCMEKNHREQILNAFPKFIQKIFLLREYKIDRPMDNASIEDPIGKSKKHYEACFNEIEKEMQRIAALILK